MVLWQLGAESQNGHKSLAKYSERTLYDSRHAVRDYTPKRGQRMVLGISNKLCQGYWLLPGHPHARSRCDMKKTIIALLLILSSAFSVYSYSPVLACVNCHASTTTVTIYAPSFNCYDIGEGQYQVCSYGDAKYFCLKTRSVNNQCVQI